ncbi:hypothetical protein D3C79_823640 [compost metagenome]
MVDRQITPTAVILRHHLTNVIHRVKAKHLAGYLLAMRVNWAQVALAVIIDQPTAQIIPVRFFPQYGGRCRRAFCKNALNDAVKFVIFLGQYLLGPLAEGERSRTLALQIIIFQRRFKRIDRFA